MCGQKVKLLIFVYFLLLFKIHYNSFPLEPLFYFVLISIQIQPRLWFDNVGAGQQGGWLKEGISLYRRKTSKKGKTKQI